MYEYYIIFITEPMLGGVHAPCSFHKFPSPCSQLLSTFCPLLPFHLFPCPFFIFFYAPCYLFSFSPAPGFLYCSMPLFIIFGASCSRIIICLLPAPLAILWLAPLCQIGFAPCSGITPNRGSLLFIC